MIYEWKWKVKGAPDAQEAGEYIEAIKKKRGGITPQLLVVEASKKRSPLHDCFEWNDIKAAKEYREVQAREILRFLIIEVEPETETEEAQYVRAFISPQEIEQDDNTSYVTIEEIRSDKDLHEAYLRQLKCELDAFKDKIDSYKEFAKVVRAIEKIKI